MTFQMIGGPINLALGFPNEKTYGNGLVVYTCEPNDHCRIVIWKSDDTHLRVNLYKADTMRDADNTVLTHPRHRALPDQKPIRVARDPLEVQLIINHLVALYDEYLGGNHETHDS